MEIAVPSPTRLISHSLLGQTYKIKREVNQNDDINGLPLTKETPASLESEIKADISSLNKNKIDYQVNLETNELVIRVLDSESGEVIRQIPDEEFLRLTSRITEFNQKILNTSM